MSRNQLSCELMLPLRRSEEDKVNVVHNEIVNICLLIVLERDSCGTFVELMVFWCESCSLKWVWFTMLRF